MYRLWSEPPKEICRPKPRSQQDQFQSCSSTVLSMRSFPHHCDLGLRRTGVESKDKGGKGPSLNFAGMQGHHGVGCTLGAEGCRRGTIIESFHAEQSECLCRIALTSACSRAQHCTDRGVHGSSQTLPTCHCTSMACFFFSQKQHWQPPLAATEPKVSGDQT